jgi:hypothetical protein
VIRELLATPGVTTVAGLTRRRSRFDEVHRSLGERLVDDASTASVVVLCGPAGTQLSAAREWVNRGVDVVSTSAERSEAAALGELDAAVAGAGRRVVTGCGMSPGIAVILAAHAATLFDAVQEVSVSASGSAGPWCSRDLAARLAADGWEWRDSQRVAVEAGSSTQLSWLPDPVAAVDVSRGDFAEPDALRAAFPDVPTLTARAALPVVHRLLGIIPRRPPVGAEGDPGALRVDVTGWMGERQETVVYGLLDRPAVATAALAATVVAHLPQRRPGVTGAAAGGVPAVEMLRELHRRGVRAARVEPETSP